MLQIIVLNGDSQGTHLNLFEGFTIGASEKSDLQLSEKIFESTDFLVTCNSAGHFALHSISKKALITSGEETTENLDLIPGLIFSIDDVGFSVQESDSNQDSTSHKQKKRLFSQALKDLKNITPPAPSTYPLKPEVLFKFVRGLWINKTWSIPYQPIVFGKKSSLYFFIDKSIPSDLNFLNLSQDAASKEILLASDFANFVSVNGELISGPKKVSSGDLIEFGQTAFYIEFK